MGILRSDIVSHSQLEPTGSVLLDGNSDYLSWSDTSIKLGTSDFTLEAWINITADTSLHQTIFMAGDSSDAGEMVFQVITAGSGSAIGSGAARELGCRIAGGEAYSGFQITYGEWTHVACVRDGGTMTFFVNGVKGNSTAETENLTTAFTQIGYRDGSYNGYFNGYISNARIALGALYKNSFTPSKFELENVPGTLLLCCQSSSSATTAAVAPGTITANGTAAASAVAPNVKKDNTDTGVVLADNTKFDTPSYMVPPGGTTAQRGRGRAVFGSGETPTNDKVMDYVQIQSMGTAIKFGDFSATNIAFAAVSSSTRGVFAVGISPNITMEYITFATTSNSTDFGDQNEGHIQEASCSNNTRGLFAGGLFAPNTVYNSIEYITIATTGNDTDFGDLTRAGTGIGGLSDTTRGVWAGGITGSPYPKVNIIDYVTIATTGNATDFGDLTFSARDPGSLASSTRGLIGGGNTPSLTNVIDYITIQTTGNAADYGDLTAAQANPGCTSNGTRGLWATGATPTIVNSVEYTTIATTGNASDFGDLTRAVYQEAACSDSHGGLS